MVLGMVAIIIATTLYSSVATVIKLACQFEVAPDGQLALRMLFAMPIYMVAGCRHSSVKLF
jgi:hypothetical protein